MDVPRAKPWSELVTYVHDKEYWRTRVRSMRQPSVVQVDVGRHVEAGSWAPFTVSS